METVLKAFILAAMAAAASVLAPGLFNMAHGGRMNANQRLMRCRIALQFVAIFAIMAAVYLVSH